MKWGGVYLRRSLLCLVIFAAFVGCGTTIRSPEMTLTAENNAILFGQISTQLTGPTTRAFQPEVQFFELVHQETGRQYRIEIDAQISPIVFAVIPGNYVLTRIMIREGAFRAMANFEWSFRLEENTVNDLGRWDIMVSSPAYNRTIQIEASSRSEDMLMDLHRRYPTFTDFPIVTQNLTPSAMKSRLFEMSPYPKFRYFNRHHST